jgi:hypothetical protein
LGTERIDGPLAIKGRPDNSGSVYIGDATVSSSVGYALQAGAEVIFPWVGSLSSIWVDVDTDGNVAHWLKLNA